MRLAGPGRAGPPRQAEGGHWRCGSRFLGLLSGSERLARLAWPIPPSPSPTRSAPAPWPPAPITMSASRRTRPAHSLPAGASLIAAGASPTIVGSVLAANAAGVDLVNATVEQNVVLTGTSGLVLVESVGIGGHLTVSYSTVGPVG